MENTTIPYNSEHNDCVTTIPLEKKDDAIKGNTFISHLHSMANQQRELWNQQIDVNMLSENNIDIQKENFIKLVPMMKELLQKLQILEEYTNKHQNELKALRKDCEETIHSEEILNPSSQITVMETLHKTEEQQVDTLELQKSIVQQIVHFVTTSVGLISHIQYDDIATIVTTNYNENNDTIQSTNEPNEYDKKYEEMAQLVEYYSKYAEQAGNIAISQEQEICKLQEFISKDKPLHILSKVKEYISNWNEEEEEKHNGNTMQESMKERLNELQCIVNESNRYDTISTTSIITEDENSVSTINNQETINILEQERLKEQISQYENELNKQTEEHKKELDNCKINYEDNIKILEEKMDRIKNKANERINLLKDISNKAIQDLESMTEERDKLLNILENIDDTSNSNQIEILLDKIETLNKEINLTTNDRNELQKKLNKLEELKIIKDDIDKQYIYIENEKKNLLKEREDIEIERSQLLQYNNDSFESKKLELIDREEDFERRLLELIDKEKEINHKYMELKNEKELLQNDREQLQNDKEQLENEREKLQNDKIKIQNEINKLTQYKEKQTKDDEELLQNKLQLIKDKEELEKERINLLKEKENENEKNKIIQSQDLIKQRNEQATLQIEYIDIEMKKVTQEKKQKEEEDKSIILKDTINDIKTQTKIKLLKKNEEIEILYEENNNNKIKINTYHKMLIKQQNTIQEIQKEQYNLRNDMLKQYQYRTHWHKLCKELSTSKDITNTINNNKSNILLKKKQLIIKQNIDNQKNILKSQYNEIIETKDNIIYNINILNESYNENQDQQIEYKNIAEITIDKYHQSIETNKILNQNTTNKINELNTIINTLKEDNNELNIIINTLKEDNNELNIIINTLNKDNNELKIHYDELKINNIKEIDEYKNKQNDIDIKQKQYIEAYNEQLDAYNQIKDVVEAYTERETQQMNKQIESSNIVHIQQRGIFLQNNKILSRDVYIDTIVTIAKRLQVYERQKRKEEEEYKKKFQYQKELQDKQEKDLKELKESGFLKNLQRWGKNSNNDNKTTNNTDNDIKNEEESIPIWNEEKQIWEFLNTDGTKDIDNKDEIKNITELPPIPPTQDIIDPPDIKEVIKELENLLLKEGNINSEILSNILYIILDDTTVKKYIKEYEELQDTKNKVLTDTITLPKKSTTYNHTFTSVTSRYATVDDPSFSSNEKDTIDDITKQSSSPVLEENVGNSFMGQLVMRNSTRINNDTSNIVNNTNIDDIRNELLIAAGEIDVATNDAVRQRLNRARRQHSSGEDLININKIKSSDIEISEQIRLSSDTLNSDIIDPIELSSDIKVSDKIDQIEFNDANWPIKSIDTNDNLPIIDVLQKNTEMDQLQNNIEMDQLQNNIEMDQLQNNIEMDQLQKNTEMDQLQKNTEMGQMDQLQNNTEMDQLQNNIEMDQLQNTEMNQQDNTNVEQLKTMISSTEYKELEEKYKQLELFLKVFIESIRIHEMKQEEIQKKRKELNTNDIETWTTEQLQLLLTEQTKLILYDTSPESLVEKKRSLIKNTIIDNGTNINTSISIEYVKELEEKYKQSEIIRKSFIEYIKIQEPYIKEIYKNYNIYDSNLIESQTSENLKLQIIQENSSVMDINSNENSNKMILKIIIKSFIEYINLLEIRYNEIQDINIQERKIQELERRIIEQETDKNENWSNIQRSIPQKFDPNDDITDEMILEQKQDYQKLSIVQKSQVDDTRTLQHQTQMQQLQYHEYIQQLQQYIEEKDILLQESYNQIKKYQDDIKNIPTSSSDKINTLHNILYSLLQKSYNSNTIDELTAYITYIQDTLKNALELNNSNPIELQENQEKHCIHCKLQHDQIDILQQQQQGAQKIVDTAVTESSSRSFYDRLNDTQDISKNGKIIPLVTDIDELEQAQNALEEMTRKYRSTEAKLALLRSSTVLDDIDTFSTENNNLRVHFSCSKFSLSAIVCIFLAIAVVTILAQERLEIGMV